ncbi:alkyl hydroperoxide reductase subunit F [Luteipulveratus sp. YIM 133132]|uniref:alkyl hydroperoxide reductase subunit F n=1 Tax=Luteipulveratus flavus TaxID=3031728 RepID=UPI0023AF9FD7|nr:alkyl hydroperoxide reductase subunit F [Luteipulveratus sp. YIM 133132]MDE9364098.1 alkyl hydroperoxide reductase subunit F [Luteipulveratus sp. YIM 133132]
MLDANLTAQLAAYLEKIRQPIVLRASLDDGTKSAELRGLLDQIAGLSDSVTASYDGTDARRPSFVIERVGSPDVAVTFAGIPLGHEFTSLVLGLLQVGGHPSKEAVATIEQIRDLTGEHHFETFFSLSCQNCPDVVQALNLMSILNPGITHTAIDGGVFPDEAKARAVLAVPTVFKDGEVFGQGRMALDEILTKVDSGAADRATSALEGADPYDVLVIGGGPAGAAAAIYAARKGIRTGLVAERFGGQTLDTMAIENFVSVPHTEGPRFAADLERHVKDYDVELITSQRAAELVTEPDAAGHLGVRLDSGPTLRGRTVVLATGARWRTMDVPGEDDYRNKGVTFCPHCDGPLFKGKPVAVIGGGNSGVEAAIDLAGLASHVTLIEYADRLGADEVLQRKVRSLANVDVVLSARTTEVLGDGSKVTGLTYESRTDRSVQNLDVSGIFVQIGLLPNTEWLKESVAVTRHGEVEIDAAGATNVPGVFAAGDCTTTPYKQIVVATGAGSTAALSAFDHLIRS